MQGDLEGRGRFICGGSVAVAPAEPISQEDAEARITHLQKQLQEVSQKPAWNREQEELVRKATWEECQFAISRLEDQVKLLKDYSKTQETQLKDSEGIGIFSRFFG
jgi:hypothetical protein